MLQSRESHRKKQTTYTISKALCHDLFDDMGWGNPYDKCNPNARMLLRVTNNAGPKTVHLRSNVSREVKVWLESRGF